MNRTWFDAAVERCGAHQDDTEELRLAATRHILGLMQKGEQDRSNLRGPPSSTSVTLFAKGASHPSSRQSREPLVAALHSADDVMADRTGSRVQIDAIHKLKAEDRHFARLLEEYDEVNDQVHRAETNLEPVDQLTEVDLRKRRLMIKDAIADALARAK